VGKLGMKPKSSLTTLLLISRLKLYALGKKYQGKSPKKAGFFARIDSKT
jgi:hypothetical protein